MTNVMRAAPQGHSQRVCIDGKSFARNGQRLLINGVTYGPFAPDAQGQQFPAPAQVQQDFAQMREAGLNSIRTYHVPPTWFLDLVDEAGLTILIDVPWPKHLCFLDSLEAQKHARSAVGEAAQRSLSHHSLLGLSIGNEIPPDIVRWHGARRVERFLAELTDVAKQSNPDALVTFANFPPTEYLELPFLDFATFNVYLHDPDVFRRYLFRLQNRLGDRPFVLGEIGMDTLRHPEAEQAEFLYGHLREARLMGLAGAFVFAWTDDWFTGGYKVEDWAFGITHADRLPKPARHSVASVAKASPSALLDRAPRVSVVVCSYNGAATLEQCLRSLSILDYPDYEVILVDDGSTDNTPEISACFPDVRTIRQSNQGLSVARNVGLAAATGEIVAYTDSDCFADPHWLTHLVHQLQSTGAAAVGGPNLTPDDGWLAACVGASPGQPAHVLETDEIAEHIPGCNMAFWRSALESVGGFGSKYRKAGDDVDACWRLQQARMWLTFAPGAFVWHHRRQHPRAYLKQQAGYGEAEALLWFDHPERFNTRGESKWQGTVYGPFVQGLRLGLPVIYRGTFGSGLFQTLYEPGQAHWTTVPSTIEWHAGVALLLLMAVLWPALWPLAALLWGVSLAVAVVRASQAPLARPYRGLKARLLISGLCYVQPLVRGWWRHRTLLAPPYSPRAATVRKKRRGQGSARLPLSGLLDVSYWDETWRERTELLQQVVAHFKRRSWVVRDEMAWSEWDFSVQYNTWTLLQVRTAQEEHGSGKRLIRVRYRLQPSGYAKALGVLGALTAALAGHLQARAALWVAFLLVLAFGLVWTLGRSAAAQAVKAIDALATRNGLIRCEPVRLFGQPVGARPTSRGEDAAPGGPAQAPDGNG